MIKLKRFFGLALAVIALAFVAAAPGCSKTTLAPNGVYQGDKILYNAEKATSSAYKLFDSFLAWELAYRAILPVEVSRSADVIRTNSKKWIDSTIALRDAYAANPTKGARDKLQTALSLLDAALTEAAKYQTDFKALAPPK